MNVNLTEQNFRDFHDSFIRELRIHAEEVSFLVYGSFARRLNGDNNSGFQPSASDYDGVIVFSNGVILDKSPNGELSKVSIIIKELGPQMPLKISVLDEKILEDGRLNSYSADMLVALNEGILVQGKDPREGRYFVHKRGQLERLAYNLDKARRARLLAEWNSVYDKEQLKKDLERCMERATRAPRQIEWIKEKKYIGSRFEGTDLEEFEEMDTQIWKVVRYFRSHPEEFEDLFKEPEKAINLMDKLLTFHESVAEKFLERKSRMKDLVGRGIEWAYR